MDPLLERDAAGHVVGFRVPMSEVDEPKLIERLKRRDEAAFNQLVRLYQDRVFGITFRMLGNRADAEEEAQEVFLTVFKAIESFRGDSKLGTWLYRVTVNHCKNRQKYQRRRAKGSHREFDELADRDAIGTTSMNTATRLPGPHEVAQGLEVERQVQAALAALPEDQRELVVLRDIEDFSYEEIREITGLPEGTVKSRLHRARLALQQRLEAMQGESR